MRKPVKGILVLAVALCLMVSSSMVSLAGEWKQDDTGLWYQNDNGSYPVSQWLWIDGNNDGIAESYYFDQNGYALVNTVTPDNYTVNESGAWVIDGIPQYRFKNDTLQRRLGSMSFSWFKPKSDYDGNGVFFDLGTIYHGYSQEETPQALSETAKSDVRYNLDNAVMGIKGANITGDTEINVGCPCDGPEKIDYYLTSLKSEFEALGLNAHLTVEMNSDTFAVLYANINYLQYK